MLYSMADILSSFNLLYLRYNKVMSKDDNTQTLEQLKDQIPALINVQTFDESLAICLANIFQITENESSISIDNIKTNVFSYCLKPNISCTDYCYEKLADILFKHIIQYTIPKSEIKEAEAKSNPSYIIELQEKAKQRFVDYWKNRKLILEQENIDDESVTKSGEGGEELLFLFAEQILGLPQALCKMNLKTSGSMHFHGADGIHIGLTEDNSKLALYYSEVKVYKDVDTAIKKCLESITPLLKREEKEQFELNLLNSNLDIGNNVMLANKLKEYFNPNRIECTELTEIRGLCLIAFNEEKYENFDYEQNARNIRPAISDWMLKFEKEKINNDIKDIIINVFFIPMTCIETFRETFRKKIGC